MSDKHHTETHIIPCFTYKVCLSNVKQNIPINTQPPIGFEKNSYYQSRWASTFKDQGVWGAVLFFCQPSEHELQQAALSALVGPHIFLVFEGRQAGRVVLMC